MPRLTSRPAALILASLSALMLGACDTSPTEGTRGVDSLTVLPRAFTATEQEGVQANNQFALHLLRTTATASGNSNVLLSPLSVTFALGLTMNGAAGETLAEMQRTLGWGTRGLTDINGAYRTLSTMLPALDSIVTMRLANGVWLRSGMMADTGFIRTARDVFGAPVQSVATPQLMYDSVNAWGNRETQGLVPQVMKGPPPADLVMMLANAVMFAGTWREKFDAAQTAPQPFRTAGGQQVSVPMMRREAGFNAYDHPDLEAVELLYGNGAYSMVLMRPREGGAYGSAAALAASLDSTRYGTVIRGLHPATAPSMVFLPRFKVSASRDLSSTLQTMGMTKAFSMLAEFPALIPGVRTTIGFVQHGVALEVDERGTRAAAVTAVGIRTVSLPPSYRFDVPFVFVIRERLSGTVIFIGVINDPR